MDELVFAIPTDNLWNELPYIKKGFIPENDTKIDKIIRLGQFLSRNSLEYDPAFKQIIPYAVISNDEAFYMYRRKSQQAENRLHNKYSLGLGGHINPGSNSDYTLSMVCAELKRELFEEISMVNGCSIVNIDFLGFINDDTIPVGTVHLGLLFKIIVSNKDIHVKEKDKIEATWITKQDLLKLSGDLESWSDIALNYLLLRNDTN